MYNYYSFNSRSHVNQYAFILLILVFCTQACHPLVEEGIRLQDEYQVLGIQVDPPVVRPDDQVMLTVYDHHPTLNSLKYSWQICLYSYGSATDFECVDPALLIPIETESPRVTISLDETGLDVRKLFAAYRSIKDINGELRNLEEGIDLYIILKSGDPKKALHRTVKKIRVIDAVEDQVLPHNPVIDRWTISESDVVNVSSDCVQSPRLNQEGQPGLERQDLMAEMSPLEACIVHAKAKVSVKVDLANPDDEAFDDSVYTWYTNKEVYANPSITDHKDLGIYQLPNRKGELNLIFTVRTSSGGFAIAQQPLIVVENKDSITDSNF